MKKKYITPRVSVEKMDVPLLIQTSEIPIVLDEPESLDWKAFFYDIDEKDVSEGVAQAKLYADALCQEIPLLSKYRSKK